eukprot:442019_1
MAQGAPPYSNLPPYPAMLKITQQDPPNVPESFSKEFRDFIRQCLTKDVSKRPRINELIKHPFIKKGATKTSHLISLIQKHQQSKKFDVSGKDLSDDEEFDQFSQHKEDKQKKNQRDVSVEWTFGTAATDDEDDEKDINYNGNLYDDKGDFDDGTFFRTTTDHKEKLQEAANGYQSDDNVEFDGGTMVRTGGGTAIDNDNENGDQYASDNTDEFNTNETYQKIKNTTKVKTTSLNSLNIRVPKPKFSNAPSSISYSIGIQTIGIETFDKSTQTHMDNKNNNHQYNNTVSDLVGVYGDIDGLFNVLANHIDNDGQKHLEILREKVKKLTHMKITERKMSKAESANSIQIARDRIQQIRQRRADLKQKHNKVKPIDENDTAK